MDLDVEIALAASPREWSQRLHRHVVDHGGARVRATVLHPQDACNEQFEVFIADDTTSFLSRGLVESLHQLGRAVLGVHDAEDAAGKGELLDIGVDDVIERTAPPEEFVAALAALALQLRPSGGAATTMEDDTAFSGIVAGLDRGRSKPAATGRRAITVVGGPPGGCGVTEIATELAASAARRGDRCVLIDADESAPALAQRLGLRPYPNLRTAVDVVQSGSGGLLELAAGLEPLPLLVLPGLASGRDWVQVRPAEVNAVVRRFAERADHTIVNIGHCLEDLPAYGGPARYAQARTVLANADVVVGVGAPTPVGVARLLAWVAEVQSLVNDAALHLIVNRTPSGPFVRGEISAELRRSCSPRNVWFVPQDGRVAAAAWSGGLVRPGPFRRTLEPISAAVLPPQRGPGKRSRRVSRR